MSSQTSKPKVPVSASSSYSDSDQFASALRTALVANSSIPTIQESLHNELQRTGWSANLRAYVTALMRSGECTNYEQLMEKVLSESLSGLNGPDAAGPSSAGQAAAAARADDPGLKIPESVKEKGVKVVKAEIKKVVDVEGEEGDA